MRWKGAGGDCGEDDSGQGSNDQQRGGSVIGAEFGLDQERVAVIVRFGVVTVAGSVPSGAVAFRILDAIKRLEGVVGVRNRVSYPEKARGRYGQARRFS